MNICIMSCFEDLQFNDSGSSVRIYNLARSLSNLGHEIHIIIPGVSNEQRIIYENVTIHVITSSFPLIIFRMLSNLMGAIKFTSLYFYDPFFILKSYPLLQRSDIIQIEQPWAAGLLIPFIRAFVRKPAVLDAHDVFQSRRLHNENFLRRISETFLEKICYYLANFILVVSDKEKEILIEEGITSRKILVIPNGVDTNVFSRSYSNDQNQIEILCGLKNFFKVIFVGNMEYFPNQEAVQIITSKISPTLNEILGNVKFILVGKCPNSLRNKCNNVIFTGVVENVADYLNISNVAIAPLLKGSGTRLKLLEYFSCELPVVSTSIGAEGLNIENGVNILIEDNIYQFAYKIKRLLTDDSLSKLLGTNARNFVVERYTWTKICLILNDAYINLC